MSKAYLILGIVSLVVGITLLAMSLTRGVKLLGLTMGGLLVLNGVVRLWLARRTPSRPDIATDKRVS